jgi:hypothetical protein
VTAPFRVQVQVDFLLGTARRAVAAGSGTSVQRYNAALMDRAGELHVAIIAKSLGLSFEGVDPEAPVDQHLMEEENLFPLLEPQAFLASHMQAAVERALALGKRRPVSPQSPNPSVQPPPIGPGA